MNPGKDTSADPLAPASWAADLEGEPIFIKYGYDGTGDHTGLTAHLCAAGIRSVLGFTVHLMCGVANPPNTKPSYTKH